MDPIIVIHKEQLRTLIEEAVRRVLAEREDKVSAENTGPLSIKEAASYLNLSVATLYRYTSQRIIPHHKPGKVLYFLQDELDSWLQEHRKLTQMQISSGDNLVISLVKSKSVRKN